MVETIRQSRWQQFFRSPWTWLVLAASQWIEFDTLNPHNNTRWIDLAFAIIFGINFFTKANKRWGKP